MPSAGEFDGRDLGPQRQVCVNPEGCSDKEPEVLPQTELLESEQERFSAAVSVRGLKLVRQAGRSGAYLFTIALKNGFHYVPVHPSDRLYFAFRWRGCGYQYSVLPLGLSASLYCFKKVLRAMLQSLYSHLHERC